MIKRHGFWWPDSDVLAAQLITRDVGQLQNAVELCKHTRAVVQAGGNVGVYPKWLSSRFDQVYTFEVDLYNFALLEKNIQGVENINAVNAGLGAVEESVDIIRCDINCGANHISAGSTASVIPLDILNLGNIDLIQLDVEGYEERALTGARRTIKRCRPVIMVENRGHGSRYKSHDLITFIREIFAYRVAETLDYDVILVPEERAT